MIHPKNHQIEKVWFLGISRYKFKLRFWFNLNLYREIWVSGFGGFQGCSISVVTGEKKGCGASGWFGRRACWGMLEAIKSCRTFSTWKYTIMIIIIMFIVNMIIFLVKKEGSCASGSFWSQRIILNLCWSMFENNHINNDNKYNNGNHNNVFSYAKHATFWFDCRKPLQGGIPTIKVLPGSHATLWI